MAQAVYYVETSLTKRRLRQYHERRFC